jgi:hypothetical protein
MKEETKCYCGHTTYCDCGPEQERSYSKKEVINIIYKIYDDMGISISLEDVVEQFKKK